MVRKSRLSRSRPPTRQTDREGDEHADGEVLRTQMRHLEVAIATVLWAGGLPLLLVTMPYRYLTWTYIVLMACFTVLIIHSMSLRPFCFDTVAEEGEDDLPPDNDRVMRDECEELKMMFVATVLLSAFGCIISSALGGVDAFHSWFESGTKGCSVVELGELQKAGYGKFFCDDGFVDLSKQASILTKGAGFRGGMRFYHMAPLYKSQGSKVPVAWSVSRDAQLSTSPCGSGNAGMCGLFIPPPGKPCTSSLGCLTVEERGRFAKLQDVITKALHADGAAIVGAEKLPMLILTDPHNPLGYWKHLIAALGFWAFTMLGLLLVLADILLNEMRCKGSNDPDMPYQQVHLDEDVPQKTVNVKFASPH